jgi:hypothetical protein
MVSMPYLLLSGLGLLFYRSYKSAQNRQTRTPDGAE